MHLCVIYICHIVQLHIYTHIHVDFDSTSHRPEMGRFHAFVSASHLDSTSGLTLRFALVIQRLKVRGSRKAWQQGLGWGAACNMQYLLEGPQ